MNFSIFEKDPSNLGSKPQEVYLRLIVHVIELFSEKMFMSCEGVKIFSEKLFMSHEGVKLFSKKMFMSCEGVF